MKEFTYTITDPIGLHARPAGLLAKQAKELSSVITVTKADGRSAVATRLMAVMALAIKQGETITIRVEGDSEEADAAAMEQFCKANL